MKLKPWGEKWRLSYFKEFRSFCNAGWEKLILLKQEAGLAETTLFSKYTVLVWVLTKNRNWSYEAYSCEESNSSAASVLNLIYWFQIAPVQRCDSECTQACSIHPPTHPPLFRRIHLIHKNISLVLSMIHSFHYQCNLDMWDFGSLTVPASCSWQTQQQYYPQETLKERCPSPLLLFCNLQPWWRGIKQLIIVENATCNPILHIYCMANNMKQTSRSLMRQSRYAQQPKPQNTSQSTEFGFHTATNT